MISRSRSGDQPRATRGANCAAVGSLQQKRPAGGGPAGGSTSTKRCRRFHPSTYSHVHGDDVDQRRSSGATRGARPRRSRGGGHDHTPRPARGCRSAPRLAAQSTSGSGVQDGRPDACSARRRPATQAPVVGRHRGGSSRRAGWHHQGGSRPTPLMDAFDLRTLLISPQPCRLAPIASSPTTGETSPAPWTRSRSPTRATWSDLPRHEGGSRRRRHGESQSRCVRPDARAIGRSTAARTDSSLPTRMRPFRALVTAV